MATQPLSGSHDARQDAQLKLLAEAQQDFWRLFRIMPGGFGTLDEFFEAVTLIQTNKTSAFPVILMGKQYWDGLIRWMKDTMIPEGTIDESELSLFSVTEDPVEGDHN